MARRPILKWVRRVWITLGLAVLALLVWNVQAHGVPPELLESTDRLTVDTRGEFTLFLPVPDTPGRAGLVFLPGGGVDWRAYVPFVRGVADAGHPAAVVRLPFRLAPTDSTRAELWRRIEDVRAAWGPNRLVVLSGHSRGAALAAGFAGEHPRFLDGLLLVATTHPRDHDLSDLTVPVVKVMAEHDCVATPAAARANAHLLPPDAQWVEIAGGNHAQFGHYGAQFNDCTATIPRDTQQEQARDAAIALLDQVSAPSSR
jgi:pimeloyl-ACP methyl ester carboxylesterase